MLNVQSASPRDMTSKEGGAPRENALGGAVPDALSRNVATISYNSLLLTRNLGASFLGLPPSVNRSCFLPASLSYMKYQAIALLPEAQSVY